MCLGESVEIRNKVCRWHGVGAKFFYICFAFEQDTFVAFATTFAYTLPGPPVPKGTMPLLFE